MRYTLYLSILLLTIGVSHVPAGQLSPRPTEEWIKRMERPERIAELKIDEIIAKLRLKPGDVVADIGAGPGVFSLRLAKAVAPGGKVYAVEIDQPFLDHINRRAKEQSVTNAVTVLGKHTDPNLPARDVDLAFFHDVLHHIEDRAGYLKSLASYIKPSGRIAVIDLDPVRGSHRNDPKLRLTKDQVKAWMADAGFAPVEEFDLFDDKWFVVYARRPVASAAAAATGAQEQAISVQVSLGDVSLNKLMYVIAHEEGIYRKNGLDVTQFINPRAAEVVRRSGVHVPAQYIRQGDAADVPITIGGGTPTIVGMTTNATAVQRVILSTTDPVVRWHIIARPEITRPEQLKGRRLGYSGYGAMTHFMCLAFVEQMGWDRDRDLSLMANGAALDVLKDGRVDAFVADELDHTIAIAAGFKSILNLGQYRIPIAGSSVNADRTWLKANREAARRFVKSTVEAIALMKQDRQVLFRAMTKWYNLTDPKHQEFFYAAAADLPRKPYPAVEGIKKTIELYGYHELRKHSPEDFYDDSFVKELDRSGYIDSLYK